MKEDTRGFWFRQPRHPRAPKPKVETEEVIQITIETGEAQEQFEPEETVEGEVMLQTEEEIAEGGLVEAVEEEN